MAISKDKEDRIYNALVVGMALNDAYIYAGLSPAEIQEVTEDDYYQSKWGQLSKGFEFTLLSSLNDIRQKQVKMGKEAATTWMLEKMFPRYSSKPQNEMPAINIVLPDQDPAELDTVEIHASSDEGNNAEGRE